MAEKAARRRKPARYILNPEHRTDPEVRRRALDGCQDTEDQWVRFPEVFDREIPEEGAWIIVTKPPHCSYTVPQYSIWYAVPYEGKSYHSSGTLASFPVRLAEIITPSGPLCVYSYEYVIIDNITDYIGKEDEGISIQYLSEASAVDPLQTPLHTVTWYF